MRRAPAKPRKYDIRVVDQLYAHCHTVAQIEERHAALVESLHATQRIMWMVVLGGTFVCSYIMYTISQVIALL